MVNSASWQLDRVEKKPKVTNLCMQPLSCIVHTHSKLFTSDGRKRLVFLFLNQAAHHVASVFGGEFVLLLFRV